MTPAPLDTNRIGFWPARLGAILTRKVCRGCGGYRIMPRSFDYCASCTAPQRVRQLQREVRDSTDRGETLSHFHPTTPHSPLSVATADSGEASLK